MTNKIKNTEAVTDWMSATNVDGSNVEARMIEIHYEDGKVFPAIESRIQRSDSAVKDVSVEFADEAKHDSGSDEFSSLQKRFVNVYAAYEKAKGHKVKAKADQDAAIEARVAAEVSARTAEHAKKAAVKPVKG